MKQIRLKHRIKKISGCDKCPFWSIWVAECTEGGNAGFRYSDRFPRLCPLEEYVEVKIE